MADDPDCAWYLPARERMRARLARAMARVLRSWQESGQRERMLGRYQSFRDVDPSALEHASFKPSVTDR